MLETSIATVLCLALAQVTAPAAASAPSQVAPPPSAPVAPPAAAPGEATAPAIVAPQPPPQPQPISADTSVPPATASPLLNPNFEPRGSIDPVPVAAPPTLQEPPPPVLVQPPSSLPPTPPPRPRKDPDRSSGIAFLASGLALFGSAYLSSSLAGVANIDRKFEDPRDDARARAYGNRMLIPIVGPWVAISQSDSATKGWFTGLAGVAQGVGIALATVGAIRLSRAHRRRVQQFSVSPGMRAEGGHIQMSFRF